MAKGRLHETVVAQVVQSIVDGSYPPGALLPSEPELSARCGVSRLVVREAARVLTAMGLITVQHGRGSVVNPPEAWDPLEPSILRAMASGDGVVAFRQELLEARMLFEVGLAGLAAQRATPADMDEMDRALQDMEDHMETLARFVSADGRFHAAVHRAAGNRILQRISAPLRRVLEDGFYQHPAMREAVPDAGRSALQHHRRIFARIAARDAAGAQAAMRAHLEESAEHLRLLLEYLNRAPPASP